MTNRNRSRRSPFQPVPRPVRQRRQTVNGGTGMFRQLSYSCTDADDDAALLCTLHQDLYDGRPVSPPCRILDISEQPIRRSEEPPCRR